MIPSLGGRHSAIWAVLLSVLMASALEAQQVYQLDPNAFMCQERRDYVIFDQLMEAGDTAAAREYSEGRCRHLATKTQFQWWYGDLQELSPERRSLVEEFLNALRRTGAYRPSDKPAYVLVVDPVAPYIPLPGQPRERERTDPMERQFVQIRTIDDTPLFSRCYRCEALAWVKPADLSPLR